MRRLLLFLAILLAPVSAQGSDVRILFDLDGYDRDACASPMIPLRSFVVAALGGDAAAGGIIGAEFRLIGYDSGWLNTVTPNPSANFIAGDLLGDGGQIAFANCQFQQASTPVLLYTIDTLVPAAIPDVTLQIGRHNAPSNPNFQCPLVVLCDPPVFTKICVASAEAFLTACPVSVHPATWTAVRALYR